MEKRKDTESSPTAITKKSKESTVLDNIKEVIRSLKQHKGSSTQAIGKYFKEHYPKTDLEQVKKTLKEAVKEGSLTKQKASFLVTGDPIYPDLSDKVIWEEFSEGIIGEKTVKKGDEVVIKYKGTLKETGSLFDSGTLSFTVHGGEVIKGFDESVMGMRVGMRRIAQIPSSLAYGKRGSPPEIPPNSDLIFDITLERIV